MIFKTIDDDSTLSGQRIVSIFEARKIAQDKLTASLKEQSAQLEIDRQELSLLEQKVKSGMTYEQAYAESIKKASTAAKEHAVSTKGVSGATDTFVAKQKKAQVELEATATSSKVAAMGVKALKLAFNMFSGLVISFAISKIIEGFQYLAESAERAKEKLEDIRTDLTDNQSSYESNRKTLEGLRDEYDSLTKKADELGGVQNLTNEEYKRYTEIMSQILGITPKFITGWDDEGNAISNKNGLLQQSIDLLDEEYEKSLRNNTTKKKNEDVANGVITELNEFENSGDTKTASGTRYDLVWKDLKDYVDKAVTEGIDYTYKSTGVVGHDSADVAYAINEFVYGDSLYKATELNQVYGWLGSLQERILSSEESLKQFTESLSDSDNPIYQWFTDEQIDQLIEDSNAYFQELDRIQDDRETYYQKYKDQLNWNAQATTDGSGQNAYKQLSDESKSAITEYINNLDYASIKTSDDFIAMANDVKSFTKTLASDDTFADYINDIYTPQGEDESIEDYSKRVNDAIANAQKYIKDNNLSISLDFGTEDNPKGIQEFVDKLQDKYDATINRFKSDVSDTSSKELDSLNKQLDEQTQSLSNAQENLQDEYDKISKWGLDDYADQIKSGTLPSQYGNIDMDNRQIIDWNIENIEKWKDALQATDVYDDNGNFLDTYYNQLKESAEKGESIIDSVYGDVIEEIEGYGDITALAFSHVVNNDDGTFEFLGQKTAEEYLYGILDVAKQDGDMSIDHILELDKKGFENAEVYDAQGKVVGETYIHGIISGFNENAVDISSLTHFAGKDGAIQIAQSDIDNYNKQLEETKKKIDEVSKGFDDSQKIKDFFDTEGINTDAEIDEFNKVTEGIKRADAAIQKWNEHKKEGNETPISTAEELETKLKDLNSAIDEVQSAYDTLTSAVEEYNTNGGQLSIDTIQSLMGLSSDYLACLQEENGQLSINEEAVAALANAKLDEAQALAIEQAMTELDTIAKGDNTSATADYVKGNADLMTSLQTLAGEYDNVASAAMTSAQAQALSAGIDAASLKDSVATQNAMDALDKKLEMIASARKQISSGNLSGLKKSGSSSSSKSSSTDPVKEAFDAEYNLLKHNLEMEYITEEQYYNGVQALNDKYFKGKEKYLDEYRKYEEEVYKGLKSYYKSYCDDMMNYYENALDANKISFSVYSANVNKMLSDMWKSGKITAKDYWDYVQTFLNKQKDIYDDVISAVTRLLDKEIEKIDKEIGKIEDANAALEEKKTLYEDAANAVTSYIDKLIEKENDEISSIEKKNDEIQKQIDKYDSLINVSDRLYEEEQNKLNEQKDALQEKIDLINKENEAKDLQYRKEQALYELEKSRRQRNKKVFNGQEFVYTVDQEAIRENEKNLQDINTEELISSLQKEQEELDKAVEALQKYRDALGEISSAYDKIIDERNAFELLGEGYKDIIFGTNIEDWDILKDKYISAKDEITNNEKLIEDHNQKIEIWENEKEQWASLSSVIQEQTQNQAATQLFGAEWQKLIDEERLTNFDEFKNQYLNIQTQINDNTQTIESFKQKQEYYTNLKSEWESISSEYNNTVEEMHAKQVLGANWEQDVLNGRVSTLQNFRDSYFKIQQDLADAAWNSANEQIRAAKEAERAAQGVESSANKVSNGDASASTITNGVVASTSATTKYEVVNGKTNKVLKSGFSSFDDAMAYVNEADSTLKKYLKIKQYARGTNHATPGLHIVSENNLGDELIIRNDGSAVIPHGEQLYNFEGGERVIPAAKTQALLDKEDNLEFVGIEAVDKLLSLQDLSGITRFDIPNISNNLSFNAAFKKTQQQPNITIGDIHLHEVQNVPDFAKALQKHLPNISIQYNGKY